MEAQRIASDCAICLQRCIHPVRLPCDHIFCYLCVKGAANQSKRCAMCRREIPESYFDCPQLISDINEKDLSVYDDECQWFYEGRNGWWIYDCRTSDDIENAFKNNQNKCELLIAGFLYVIDFSRMIQYRRNEPTRVRRIKRDRQNNSGIKGVAGLKANLDALPTLSVQPQQQQQQLQHVMQTASSTSSSQNEETHSQRDEQLRSASSEQSNSPNTHNSFNLTNQTNQTFESTSDNNSYANEAFELNDENVSNVSNSISDDSNFGDNINELEQLIANNLHINETRQTYL